jgi:hypothetical protein
MRVCCNNSVCDCAAALNKMGALRLQRLCFEFKALQSGFRKALLLPLCATCRFHTHTQPWIQCSRYYSDRSAAQSHRYGRPPRPLLPSQAGATWRVTVRQRGGTGTRSTPAFAAISLTSLDSISFVGNSFNVHKKAAIKLHGCSRQEMQAGRQIEKSTMMVQKLSTGVRLSKGYGASLGHQLVPQ